MGNIPFAVTTPVSISRVGLKARDAEKLADYYRAVVGLEELSRARRRDHARRGGAAVAGDRGRSLRQARRSALGRPFPHRLPVAVARRSRPLGQTCHRQADSDRRRVGSSRQRGALSDRSGRQRHRDLCRPAAREMGLQRLVDRDGDDEARHSQSRRRGAGRRGGLEGRAGKQRHRPCPSARRRSRSRRKGGGTTNSASTPWRKYGSAGRVPVVRRLPPPYRRQFLAQRRRRATRSVAGGTELGRMQSKNSTGEVVREDPWGTVVKTAPAMAD